MPGGGAAARGEAPGALGRLLERGSSARGRGVTAQAPQKPADGQSEPLLQVSGLRKHFPIRKGLFSRTVGHVHAVDGVSFSIDQGETLGLVGESGCGKSTAGKTVLKLIEPTMGTIKLGGRDITHLDALEMRPLRRDMQIIFQDPYASLNPRMTVGETIGEGLRIHGLARGEAALARVAELLEIVGLRADHAGRYPHEFSGGQRQRIGIARALAMNPKFIVCDEAVSALDVSIQAQVVNLLQDLKDDLGLALLFIAHDLAVVEYISDTVIVMYLGRIMEIAPAKELYANPIHPYTEALLSAIPTPDPTVTRERILLRCD
ncbi:MAG: ABC transporter ATP-binding protein, partial [Proteobacteria bacterium]|nr:ABC transporter ATP-binding protein [Pseudomonadota bacterium]